VFDPVLTQTTGLPAAHFGMCIEFTPALPVICDARTGVHASANAAMPPRNT